MFFRPVFCFQEKLKTCLFSFNLRKPSYWSNYKPCIFRVISTQNQALEGFIIFLRLQVDMQNKSFPLTNFFSMLFPTSGAFRCKIIFTTSILWILTVKFRKNYSLRKESSQYHAISSLLSFILPPFPPQLPAINLIDLIFMFAINFFPSPIL